MSPLEHHHPASIDPSWIFVVARARAAKDLHVIQPEFGYNARDAFAAFENSDPEACFTYLYNREKRPKQALHRLAIRRERYASSRPRQFGHSRIEGARICRNMKTIMAGAAGSGRATVRQSRSRRLPLSPSAAHLGCRPLPIARPTPT
jgi:hypothetical protein